MTEQDFGKQIRTQVVLTNAAGLAVVIAAALAIIWFAPDSDATSTVIGLLSTIAGMLVKNSSTIIDYLFGGSDKG